MKENNLQYVARFFKQDTLDADKAFRDFQQRTGYRTRLFSWRHIAAAAVVLLLVGLGVMYALRPQTTVLMAENQQRSFVFSDGTEVILAPNAVLSYEGDYARNVSITGKAYLKIKHDAAKPFIIQGENYLIRDIGTQLEIRADEISTDVFVSEGSVYFASSRQKEEGIVLKEGNRGFLKSGAVRPFLRAKPSPNRAVWATHQFRFKDTALPYVLADLSDYYHVRLTCANKDKRLTGNFDADSLETIVKLIEKTLDIKIQY